MDGVVLHSNPRWRDDWVCTDTLKDKPTQVAWTGRIRVVCGGEGPSGRARGGDPSGNGACACNSTHVRLLHTHTSSTARRLTGLDRAQSDSSSAHNAASCAPCAHQRTVSGIRANERGSARVLMVQLIVKVLADALQHSGWDFVQLDLTSLGARERACNHGAEQHWTER